MTQQNMKILYLGANTGTAGHRFHALARLGHEVRQINPEDFVPKQRLLAKFHWETGGVFCQKKVAAGVMKAIGNEKFDVVWVNSGRYVGPSLVRHLRDRSKAVLNYNVDNPYHTRDRYSWTLFRKSVPSYDLMVVLREENIAEARALGARQVFRVYFCADEIAHAPRSLTPQDLEKWGSEVAFIGTCFSERGPFMAELIKLGVPLSIYGSDWQKSPEWPLLATAWKGPDTHNADDYAKSIQCSKICLGLLSKGNRDLHTTRSLEIPYLGGLLCAERTTEHQQMYREGEEAIFWDTPEECARLCFDLLEDDTKRQEITARGQERNLRNAYLNQPVMASILAKLNLD
jgi:spore maturation protein CgeB